MSLVSKLLIHISLLCVISAVAFGQNSNDEADRLHKAGGDALGKGLLGEAIKYYSESIKLNPSSPYSYDMRAVAFERAGKWKEAIADRTATLEIFLLESPPKVEAIKRVLISRGLSFIDIGKHSEARADYTKAIKIDPNDSSPYMFRGLSYYSTNNPAEAILDFNKSIKLETKFSSDEIKATVLYYRGKSYLLLNKRDEGTEDLAKAKLLSPKTFSTQESLESARNINKNNTSTPKVEIINLDKDVKLEMVLIPAGTFKMGSPANEKGRRGYETQHEVTLTKPFYMGKYEVTQEQWESVMGKNMSDIKGAKLPVTFVSWEDCQEFIKKLNAKTNGGYRLPTEAEWEYSCRAGTTTAYCFGDELSPKDANYSDSEIYKPVEVGSYKANAFGLYDTHGNVWEWCEDRFGDYTSESVTDPKGPAKGEDRVLRGGSLFDPVSKIRSSVRYDDTPSNRVIFFGFRLARTADIKATVAEPAVPIPGSTELTPETKGLLVAPFSEIKAKEAQKQLAKSLQKEVEDKADLGKDVKLEMVLVPAGKFMMGSPANEKGRQDDETQHEVTLTKPFYMGKYEVTQEQWESVMGENPSDTKGAKLPVTNVSWNVCQEFIKKLNAKTNGDYRLPTEAEFEYACRAGTTTAYSFGDNITAKDANYNLLSPVAVGSYKPNAFGLYDMHGNVWEWCNDWHGSLQDGEVTDPKGAATGRSRVLRGGSYSCNVLIARSSFRNYDSPSPSYRYNNYGFRLARTP